MLGASFLPARLRHEHNHAAQSNPGYVNRQITSLLQWVSRSAFTHPIHTIVSVALLASTCYVGVLEGSLLDHTSLGNNVGSTDLNSLMEDGRRLRLGEETSWKWQTDGSENDLSDKVGLKYKRENHSVDLVLAHAAYRSDDAGLPRLVVKLPVTDSSTAA